MKKPYWVRRAHLFRADEYICSRCRASFPGPQQTCPACGSAMGKVKVDPAWVDEAEAMSALLDEDW